MESKEKGRPANHTACTWNLHNLLASWWDILCCSGANCLNGGLHNGPGADRKKGNKKPDLPRLVDWPVTFWKQCKQIKNVVVGRTWSPFTTDLGAGLHPWSGCALSPLTTAIPGKMRQDQECCLVKSQTCRLKCKQNIWQYELPSSILSNIPGSCLLIKT